MHRSWFYISVLLFLFCFVECSSTPSHRDPLQLLHVPRRELKHRLSDYLFDVAHMSWSYAFGVYSTDSNHHEPPPLKCLHSRLSVIWSNLSKIDPSYLNSAIIDIGAGDFSGGQLMYISDAIDFALQFREHKNMTIFALEPGEKATRKLYDLCMFHNISIQIIKAAASSENTEASPLYCFRSRDEENMFSLRRPTGMEELFVLQNGCDLPVDYVQTVRLDTLFRNQTKIFYAKIDVEGWDFEVVRGAESLLENHKLDAFSFEYGLLWNPTFHMQVYVDEHAYERPIAFGKIPSPTLREVSDWLDDHEFEVYIVMYGICLPVSGEWWQDGFEICANPKRVLGTMWCIVDILALRKNTAIQKLFLDECNRSWKWHLEI